MIKTVVSILVISAVIVALGSGIHLYKVSQKNKHEMSKYTLSVRPNAKTGRTLVVYFSLGGHTKAVAEKIADFSKYDTIFVGGPVWWYAPATPLLAFLEKADFKSKKVVPFSTQGSNYGSFFVDFERIAKNAKLRPSASFNNISDKYAREQNNKIISWINSIR